MGRKAGFHLHLLPTTSDAEHLWKRQRCPGGERGHSPDSFVIKGKKNAFLKGRGTVGEEGKNRDGESDYVCTPI